MVKFDKAKRSNLPKGRTAHQQSAFRTMRGKNPPEHIQRKLTVKPQTLFSLTTGFTRTKLKSDERSLQRFLKGLEEGKVCINSK